MGLSSNICPVSVVLSENVGKRIQPLLHHKMGDPWAPIFCLVSFDYLLQPPSTIRKCFRSLLFRTSVIPQTKHSEAWRRTAMNWEWLLSRSYVKSCEVMEISEFDQHFNSGPWNISTPLSCQHPRKPGSRKAIREVSIVLTSGANMPRVVGRRNDSSTKSQSPEFGSNSW